MPTRFAQGVLHVAVLAIAAVSSAGCASGRSSSAPAVSAASVTANAGLTPVAVSPSASVVGDATVYAMAVKEFQTYLDTWARDGAVKAAARYLVPSEQPTSTNGVLVLTAGHVVSYKPFSWTSADEFTLSVTMDLHFSNPEALAGGDPNHSFVTFTRPNSHTPYRMYLATGP